MLVHYVNQTNIVRNHYLFAISLFLFQGKIFSQTITITGPTTVAPGAQATYTASFNYPNGTITWTVIGGSTITPPTNTTCIVLWDNTTGKGSIKAFDATNNVTKTLIVNRVTQPPVLCAVANAGNDVTICTGSSATIGTPAVAGYTYSWSPATGLNNPNISQPSANPSQTTTYTLTMAQNLIPNGDFELGNLNYNSDYPVFPDAVYGGPGSGGTGTRTVTTSPGNLHNSWCPMADHSPVGSNMFVTDGSSLNAPNYRFWFTTINVQPNTNYLLSGWAVSISAYTADFRTTLTGNNSGSTTLDVQALGYINYLVCRPWQNFQIPWNSGNNTQVTIDMRFTTSGVYANDLGIDDLSLTSGCSTTTDNVIVTTGGGAPGISPAGPITYYNQYETTNQVVLTSTPAASYQWYKNNAVIPGATNQTYAAMYSGLSNITDLYKVVTSCGTSNTVTFNYRGCHSTSCYPVTIPSNICYSSLPYTLTAPNLGTGTIYSWWTYSNPSDLSFSNFSGNTCQLNATGPYTGPSFGDWIYTKSAKNGQETYMFYGLDVAFCRPANRGNTSPNQSNSEILIPNLDINPTIEKTRLAPNPANSQITIYAASGIEHIEIYNVSGVMVKQVKTNRSKTVFIKTNDLLAGIYPCKVVTSSGTEYLKLLIQR